MLLDKCKAGLAQLASAHHNNKQQLPWQKRTSSKQQQLQLAQDAADCANAELTTLRTDNEALRMRNETLAKELQSARNMSSSNETNLSMELEAQGQACTLAKRKLAEAMADCAALRKEVAAAAADLQHCHEELDEAQAAHNTLAAKVAHSRLQRSAAAASRVAAETACSKAERDLVDCRHLLGDAHAARATAEDARDAAVAEAMLLKEKLAALKGAAAGHIAASAARNTAVSEATLLREQLARCKGAHAKAVEASSANATKAASASRQANAHKMGLEIMRSSLNTAELSLQAAQKECALVKEQLAASAEREQLLKEGIAQLLADLDATDVLLAGHSADARPAARKEDVSEDLPFWIACLPTEERRQEMAWHLAACEANRAANTMAQVKKENDFMFENYSPEEIEQFSRDDDEEIADLKACFSKLGMEWPADAEDHC